MRNTYDLMRQWTLGPWGRMAHITRYSSLPILHKESVAEHTFFVAIKAYLLAVDMIQWGSDIDLTVVLKHAVLHDIDEAVTGDIIRPFKWSNDDLRKMMNRVTTQMLKDSLKGIPGSDALLAGWSPSPDSDWLEIQIVKCADLWSCVHYAHREYQLGNIHGKLIMADVRKWVERHQWPEELKEYASALIKLTHELEATDGV